MKTKTLLRQRLLRPSTGKTSSINLKLVRFALFKQFRWYLAKFTVNLFGEAPRGIGQIGSNLGVTDHHEIEGSNLTCDKNQLTKPFTFPGQKLVSHLL